MTARRIVLSAVTATALLFAAPALATVPLIDYTLSGPTGDNGWYTGPVTVSWSVSLATKSLGCDVQTLSTDTVGQDITCSAWNDLVQVAVTVPVKIDQTPPTGVTAAAARPPDVRSWFTSPVGITWSGDDATSGIASCTSLSYAGPDAAAATPTGACRDRAGNVSAQVPFALDYDATAPDLSGVAATAGPGRADIHWTAGPDAVRATVVREAVGAGSAPTTVADVPASTGVAADTGLAPATSYTWTVTVLDAAGNATSQRATATTPTVTAAPPTGTATSSVRPTAIELRWHTVRHASYYNVQVFTGRRKVLSAWPTRARLRLGASWRYRGRTERLVAGRTYRWYAWAGYGARSAHRYGRLLAHGRFGVPKKGG